jgi:hypothetical protein
MNTYPRRIRGALTLCAALALGSLLVFGEPASAGSPQPRKHGLQYTAKTRRKLTKAQPPFEKQTAKREKTAPERQLAETP